MTIAGLSAVESSPLRDPDLRTISPTACPFDVAHSVKSRDLTAQVEERMT